MTEASGQKSSVEAAVEALREREVPAGARVRVLRSIEAPSRTGWLPKGSRPRGVGVVMAVLALGGLAAALPGLLDAARPGSSEVPRNVSSPQDALTSPARGTDVSSTEQTVKGRAAEAGPEPIDTARRQEAPETEPGPTPGSPTEASHPHNGRVEQSPTGTQARRVVPAARTEIAPPSDTQLAAQVRDYKAALAATDANLRLQQLRAFKRKWPSSPLIHEVDLQIVATVAQLRDATLQKETAEEFLSEHPTSERAQDVRALTQEPP